MKRKIIIVILIVIEIITIHLMYKTVGNGETILKEVKLTNIEESKDMFAIYLDGVEYTSSNTWPSDAAFVKAECQNDKGDIVNDIVTYDQSKNTASVDTTETVYCYLYFVSDKTAPICNLKMSGNTISWDSKSDDKTAESKLQYILTTSTSAPSSFTNNTTISVTKAGTYYGYVKDEAGNIGKCAVIVTNKRTSSSCTYTTSQKNTSCKVTGGGPIPCGFSLEGCGCTQYADGHPGENNYCTKVNCSGNCSDGSRVSTNCNGPSTSQCISSLTSSCNARNCGSTNYSCSNGSSYTTQSGCTSQTCVETKYICSDGETYDTAVECTSKTCSPCNKGEILSGNYCYKTDKPTCELQVTESGVTFKYKIDDKTPEANLQFDISRSTTKSYSGKTSLSLSAGLYYGYVKDADGNEGSCTTTVIPYTAKNDYYDPIFTASCPTGGGAHSVGDLTTDSTCADATYPTCASNCSCSHVCSYQYTMFECPAGYEQVGTCKATSKDASGSGCYCYKPNNPKCTLKATSTGVTFDVISDNKTSRENMKYDLTKSATPTFNGTSTMTLSTGTFYGHVQDEDGNMGTCELTLTLGTSTDKYYIPDVSKSCNGYGGRQQGNPTKTCKDGQTSDSNCSYTTTCIFYSDVYKCPSGYKSAGECDVTTTKQNSCFCYK